MRRNLSRSHVSDEFIASHAPLRSDTSLRSTLIDLTSSDHDDHPRRPQSKSTPTGLIDLTAEEHNDSINSKTRTAPRSTHSALPNTLSGGQTYQGSPSIRNTMPSSNSPSSRVLPVHSKNKTHQPISPDSRSTSTSGDLSPYVSVSASPKSTTKPRNGPKFFDRPSAPNEANDETSSLSSEDESNVELPILQTKSASAGTPSKRARLKRGSQKSISSIGSSSPLLFRLKEQRSRRSPQDASSQRRSQFQTSNARQSLSLEINDRDEVPSVEQLEEGLRKLERQMKEDNALSVRWLLHDAKRSTRAAPKPFMHKTSPFASLKGVQLKLGDSAPPGSTTERVESYVIHKVNNKVKVAKSYTTVVGTTIKDDLPHVPKYSSVTITKRNFLTADDEQLRFIPYLGDNDGSTKKLTGHKRLVKELEEAYQNDRVWSSREAERAAQIRGFLSTWLDKLAAGCTEPTLQRYVLQHSSNILGKREATINMLLDSLGGPLKGVPEERAIAFATAFMSVFDQHIADVVLPDTSVREMLKSSKTEPTSPAARLSTFTDLTCLICGVVCCQVHGDYTHVPVYQNGSSGEGSDDEREPNDWEYVHQPVNMKHEDMMRKYDARTTHVDEQATYKPRRRNAVPCSDECWLDIEDANEPYEAWNEKDINTLAEILISVTDKDQQACSVAFAMNWPCWQVYSEIGKYKNSGGRQIPERPEPPLQRTGDRPGWYNNERKTLHSNWLDMTNAHLHQERVQTSSCTHEGPCIKGCSCFDLNILCESICACSDTCARRFTGCACDSLGINCTSESCICVHMNRECGPQCGSCGAIDRSNPAHKFDDDLFTTGCQNVVLQRGVSKRLMIGESQLEGVGFGLYLGEPVSKGDFLSEYAGEVISYAEADRRGIIYDRKYSSFLFDLNSEWVIDAARVGNKTRFINHADNDKDGLNCEAKIVLVNGEHRIKFIALRDLAVGEELLFNYGKKFAEKHGLSKKLPKVKEAGKKGVLVGKEALDALDGMDPENRASRKKMSSIRGGRGGGRAGKNKARKTALPKTKDGGGAATSTSAAAAAAAAAATSAGASSRRQATPDARDPESQIPPLAVGDEDDEDYYEESHHDEEEDEDNDGKGDGAHGRRRKRKITRPARYTR